MHTGGIQTLSVPGGIYDNSGCVARQGTQNARYGGDVRCAAARAARRTGEPTSTAIVSSGLQPARTGI